MEATLTSSKKGRKATKTTKEKQLQLFLIEELENYIKERITIESDFFPSSIIITNNSPQALAFVKEAEKLDFAIVTKTKVTKEKAPAKARVKAGLKKPAPTFEEETKEQYEAAMELSKIANRNIARKLAKAKNLDLPFKNAI